MKKQIELFGLDVIDDFKCAKERYGIWPLTVWECNLQDPKTKRLKELIGDTITNSTRSGTLQASYHKIGTNKYNESCYQNSVSIFNPAIASWILNCYAPKEGICFDPFAGGGTRAIMSAKHGLKYIGCEIRREEVEAVNIRCKKCEVLDNVKIHCCDGRIASRFIDEKADFLITCPPYWNLEMYNGGENDLSMIPTYEQFCVELEKVVIETQKILKPNAISCWVVGLHRDNSGHLMCLNHKVAEMHKKHGFWQKEEIILSMKNTGSIQRVGNFEKGNKFLIRTHEYVLVFVRKE